MKPGIVAAVALLPCIRAALQSCPDLSSGGPEVFDFVVVGSGAGGGPLASRLAENGFSGASHGQSCSSAAYAATTVFLVDAGNDVNTFNTTIPAYWARATEGDCSPFSFCLFPRKLMLLSRSHNGTGLQHQRIQ